MPLLPSASASWECLPGKHMAANSSGVCCWQVFEDMPQEMRSRLWYVLLERPDLAHQLLVSQQQLIALLLPLLLPLR